MGGYSYYLESTWLFNLSQRFLLWFRKIGWNYVVSSVIICVVVPLIITVFLVLINVYEDNEHSRVQLYSGLWCAVGGGDSGEVEVSHLSEMLGRDTAMAGMRGPHLRVPSLVLSPHCAAVPLVWCFLNN